MNINNVYIAKIYVKTVEKFNRDFSVRSEGEFVKDTLVYEKLDTILPCYIDLESGKKYRNFDLNDTDIGELYINIKAGLIPYTSMIENNKKNMSKRKILKNYNNSIKGNNK